MRGTPPLRGRRFTPPCYSSTTEACITFYSTTRHATTTLRKNDKSSSASCAVDISTARCRTIFYEPSTGALRQMVNFGFSFSDSTPLPGFTTISLLFVELLPVLNQLNWEIFTFRLNWKKNSSSLSVYMYGKIFHRKFRHGSFLKLKQYKSNALLKCN